MNERLTGLRKGLGLSQVDMAKVVGVGKAIYQKWEWGTNYPKVESCIKMAEFFGVTLDYLILGRESVTFSDSPVPQDVLKELISAIGFVYEHDKEIFREVCSCVTDARMDIILSQK